MNRWLILFCAVLVSLASNLDSTAAQSGLKIAKVEYINDLIKAPNARNAALSPDGTTIAFPSIEDGLCLYSLFSRQVTCTTLPETLRYIESLQWSPDSRYIAMTENFIIRLIDSDIWVFSVVDRTFADRTDDGYNGQILKVSDGKNITIDLVPFWGNTSDELYFFRTVQVGSTLGATGQALYRINPTNDADPVLVQDLSTTIPFSLAVYGAQSGQLDSTARVAPDGSRVAVLVRPPKLDAASSGIWIMDLTGKSVPKQIVDSSKGITSGLPTWLDQGLPTLEGLSWTPTGDGIIFYAGSISDYSTTVRGNLYYTDLKIVTPLIDLSGIGSLVELLSVDKVGNGPTQMIPNYTAYLRRHSQVLYLSGGASKIGLYAVAVPTDGSTPRLISEIHDYQRTPAMQVSMSADESKVLIAGYLFTLEN